MEVLGKLNIRERQGEGSCPFKALKISSLFKTVTVSSVAVGKGESFSACIVGPMREEGKKLAGRSEYTVGRLGYLRSAVTM